MSKRARSEPVEDALLLECVSDAPSFWASLSEFHAGFAESPTAPFASERAYVRHVESSVLLRSMHVSVSCALWDSNCRCDKLELVETRAADKDASGWSVRDRRGTASVDDRAALVARLSLLQRLEARVEEVRCSRLAAMERQPRLVRLAQQYGFAATSVDARLLEVLAVLATAQSSAVRCTLIEDEHSRRVNLLCRLAGASELEVESFADAERDHVKENVLYVSDDADAYASPGGIPPLRLSRVGSRVILGDALQPDELLKTSGTALERVLAEEGVTMSLDEESDSDSDEAKSDSKVSKLKVDGLGGRFFCDKKKPLFSGSHQDEEYADQVPVKTCKDALTSLLKKSKDDPETSTSSGEQEDSLSVVFEKNGIQPYPKSNELEYLTECFELIALHIRLATAKIKGAIKEQSGGGGRTGGFFPPPDEGARAGARELKAKIRVAQHKLSQRCAATAIAHAPRLLQMARKLDLDEWETRVVALLVGRTISPAIKSLMDGMEASAVQRLDDSTTVGALLSIFCPESFADQVSHRARFYKNARLIKRGVLRIARSRWHSSGSSDLTEQRIELDRRVLDYVVGLDTEINELVEGSELYAPKVELEDVVLPQGVKRRLLELCGAFAALGPFARRTGLFEHALPYGAGLIVLLCGPSGTGKTMTVHGVANRLGKRVLQVDFASLRGKHSQGGAEEVDADLRGLFREAEMSDAVLFFDECEALFRSRDFSGGSDRLLRAMLQEIERHAGLVFLATNRPAELDEAMHRRISTVVEFSPPSAEQRCAIWSNLVRKGRLRVSEDVDWGAIALKFELSGGFIKNALLSALLFALHRDTMDPVVTDADVRAGCSLQQRGVMYKHHGCLGERSALADLSEQVALKHLALRDDSRNALSQIVAFEANRSTVFGAWGFGAHDARRTNSDASIALLFGPRGGGKRTVAAALAQELKQPLYTAHARDALWTADQSSHQQSSDVAKRLKAIVDDARLTDSVLLLDGFEEALAASANATGESGLVTIAPALSRALDALATYPGVVLLVAHLEEPGALRLAPALLRRLNASIPFAKPDARLRAAVWRRIIPCAAPLAPDVDFAKLGSRHDLLPASIRRAACAAAAVCARRAEPNRHITHADLATAAENEVKRLRGDHADALDRIFL